MKYLATLLACLFMFSCTVTKYSEKSKVRDFSNIENGKTYLFYGKNKERTIVKVISQDENSFLGTSRGKEMTINKNDIYRIKQVNLPLTIGIVAGSAVVAGLVVSAMIHAANIFGSVVSGH